MIKQLLPLAAMAFLTLGASAETLDLPLTDLGSGWGDATYDAATKTITYVGAWTGKGWWLGDVDYSKYDKVIVEFEPTTFDVKVVVEYVDADATSSDAMASAGASKVTCLLNETYKNAVKQIYLQNSAVGSLTLKAAYLENDVAFDPTKNVILWEGDHNLGGWSGGNPLQIQSSDLSAQKLAAGDKLKISYTSTGGSFKVQYVTQDYTWTDLPAFLGLDGVNEQYGTYYAGTSGSIEIPVDATTLKTLLDARSILIAGEAPINITQVDIIRGDAGGSTAITEIEVIDENAPVEYYNLQGVRVENPANGLYIRRQGSNVTKVIL